MDEQYEFESDDERLVRTALLAAYPPDRSTFVLRRGEQIIRAAANERLGKRSLFGSRVAACVAASFTLMAGTAGAAGAALPGQPLYPLKRIVERAMIAVTTDDTDAARLELRFAERRLEEASMVTEEPVASTLAEKFNEHLNAANSLAGEEIADDIDDLEQSHVERQTNTSYDQSSLDSRPVDEAAPTISRTPTPTPTPTATASPSPTPSPSPSASPSPSPSPSPNSSVQPRTPLDGSTVVIPPASGMLPDLPDGHPSPSESATADRGQ